MSPGVKVGQRAERSSCPETREPIMFWHRERLCLFMCGCRHCGSCAFQRLAAKYGEPAAAAAVCACVCTRAFVSVCRLCVCVRVRCTKTVQASAILPPTGNVGLAARIKMVVPTLQPRRIFCPRSCSARPVVCCLLWGQSETEIQKKYVQHVTQAGWRRINTNTDWKRDERERESEKSCCALAGYAPDLYLNI